MDQQVLDVLRNKPFLQKYFEVLDNKIICKHILVYGMYSRVVAEYQAIYEQLNLEIDDLDTRLIFQNTVADRIKKIQYEQYDNEQYDDEQTDDEQTDDEQKLSFICKQTDDVVVIVTDFRSTNCSRCTSIQTPM
jgi:hypothetical protein